MNRFYLYSILLVFISSLTQVLLKIASKNKKTGIAYFLDYRVILSYGIMLGISMINSLYIYKGLTLSVISSLEALAYVFVSLLSFCLLKETFTLKMAIGTLLIIAGVVIFSL